MAISTLSALKQPVAALSIDEAKLHTFMASAIPGFPKTSTLSVLQFSHGQSNPTYLVEVKAAGLEATRYVLRKKPPGKLLASAHAVEREFKVLAALGKVTTNTGGKIPVPRVVCLCTDSSVIGTPFYLMEHVNGRVLQDVNLPELPAAERSAVYTQLGSVLADIHSVDPAAAGLGDFGKVDNYAERQVKRWKRQYDASAIGEGKSDFMEQLAQWLQANIPQTQPRGSIIHGDYRLDNMVFEGNSTQVLAVLDWELSTLGDPLADVSYCCMPYQTMPGMPALAGLDMENLSEGIPTESQFVAQYCTRRGIEFPSNVWPFYVALSLFRAAAISAGVHRRSVDGNASHSNAALLGPLVGFLAQRALVVAQGPPLAPPMPPAGTHVLPEASSAAGLFPLPPRALQFRDRVAAFIDEHVMPMEPHFIEHAASTSRWKIPPYLETLKAKARSAGLWNLWVSKGMKDLLLSREEGIPEELLGPGLTNVEYAAVCEVTGRSLIAPEVFNCSAPDTGNMEVLSRYGSREQRAQWLLPLLRGEIRSCFAMTEPAVASSDATNIESQIRREAGGHEYIINGRKW
ncbi:hypothetical protein CYMTET_53108 [Cymbomonas tetramitiformis]|uniref:Aminoglycoside phosphotransferase domain-containing protein n=1 Tax=Cymbomonas tetramitiformis TaxID=36881 RepID=A0AAE0EQY1_9CHLO|nr:hypothetical protein CYMTET_53108 [Cymbomonas tetramitiformis]